MYRKINELEKFKTDVKTWCHKNGMKLKALCNKLGYNDKYLSNLFLGTQYPEAEFWPKLKKTTGLKRSDYCE